MSGIHQGHEQSSEALSAYLDGALDSAERDAVERRLATCDACRAELADLRRVRALLRALPEVTPPRSFTLPATTTPPRRAGALRPGPGWARVTQWMGGLAAVIGVGLMLAGGLIHPSYPATFSAASNHSTSSQGGASSAPAPTTDHHTPMNQDLTSTAGAATAPPSPTAATTYGPIQAGSSTAAPDQGAASTAIPLGPAGVTLLVGGGAALVAGTAARRRKTRPGALP